MALVICQAFKDILEGVELEGSEATLCEFKSLELSAGLSWWGSDLTSSWLSCSVDT